MKALRCRHILTDALRLLVCLSPAVYSFFHLSNIREHRLYARH